MLWAWMTIRRFNNEIKKAVKEAVKEIENNMMGVLVEEENGQLYFYREEDRQFLCQGYTMAEAREKINKVYPEKIAYLSAGEPELVERLKQELATLKEKDSNEVSRSV